MKKFILGGVLIGLVFGIIPIHMGGYVSITWYLSLTFLTEPLGDLIHFGGTRMTLLMIFIPALIYGLLGYTIGHLLKQK